MNSEKPPLGLMPYEIWEERRIEAILEAMKRYSDAKMVIPFTWILELEDHLHIGQRDEVG